jgi:hypothetical protein
VHWIPRRKAQHLLLQSLAAQIRELAELKEAGIISEAEFESKKTQLLDRM